MPTVGASNEDVVGGGGKFPPPIGIMYRGCTIIIIGGPTAILTEGEYNNEPVVVPEVFREEDDITGSCGKTGMSGIPVVDDGNVATGLPSIEVGINLLFIFPFPLRGLVGAEVDVDPEIVDRNRHVMERTREGPREL